MSTHLPADYPALLADIKQRVRHAQTRAMLAVNAELIRLYWDIGALIDQRQKREGWGAAVIPRLARDLHNELPEEKVFRAQHQAHAGFLSRVSLSGCHSREHRKCHRPWHNLPQRKSATGCGTKPPGAGVAADGAQVFSPDVLLSLPWGHHAELIAKVKEPGARHWYMCAAIENGWSRSVLLMQIETAAHLRQGRAASNFALRLPPPDSDLVQQTLKDPYLFDFLTLESGFHERELETGLITHLEKFLLELGQGFAFVGRQYHLDLAGDDFYIDLLFYHLKLRCYVVIDLKRGDFKPEYAGKMNFYCNVVDDRLRHATDQPTIGLILCQKPNHVLAEYALRGVDKPIGVSGFELTRALPETLQSSLPSIEQIERELGGGHE